MGAGCRNSKWVRCQLNLRGAELMCLSPQKACWLQSPCGGASWKSAQNCASRCGGFAREHSILSLKDAEHGMGSADLDAEMTSIGPVEEDAGWSPAATEQDGSRGPIRVTDATAAVAPTQAGQSAAYADAPGGLPAGLTASSPNPFTPLCCSAPTRPGPLACQQFRSKAVIPFVHIHAGRALNSKGEEVAATLCP